MQLHQNTQVLCYYKRNMKDVEPIIRIEDVDGARLVLEFADEIERMLGSKMKSVKRLADTAEDADLYHEYNASLQFDYFNALLVNTMDEEGNFIELGGEFPLEENEHFNKLSVNTLMSDIQVPTNVYNKDPNILNGVYMSEALNDVFISNFQKDPTLTWQYFGSSAGFFRLYPGIKWTPDSNGVVSFDCRNRNWYIQAATSPKDIVILVDVSGSMKGLKMTIAKHTINTILDTLGENDFENYITYTDYVRYVEPCFKGTLVQADLDNREHFKLLVEELHVKGEAKVKKAVKESFRILADARANGQGSLCNQAIMLITDGAMEDFQSVFEEFNWPDKKVRVFTYLIGRDMRVCSQPVLKIIYSSPCYYTHISTLADVQENVMEYLHVLSRPMVINHDHDIIWTEAYMDSVLPNTKELFKSKAHSLLLMTSVAMPVFSKKKETLSHGILLGVVGTDVPLLEVMKLAPRYKLGAHGYAFLITNNGYILAHPDLRPLYIDGKKLKPKPNYNSVDLSEAEWEDTEDSLRTAMVKGETGTLTLDVRAAVDKGVSVLFLKNEYFYTTINETPFSFGMVLTRGHGQYMFFGNVSVEEGLHDLQQPDLTIADEWTYCETDIDPHHRKLTQLQAVVRYLTGKEPDLECDEILLQQVLFDAVVTAPLEAYWTALMLTAPGVDEGIESAFLGTRSGLMRVIRYAGSEKRVGNRHQILLFILLWFLCHHQRLLPLAVSLYQLLLFMSHQHCIDAAVGGRYHHHHTHHSTHHPSYHHCGSRSTHTHRPEQPDGQLVDVPQEPRRVIKRPEETRENGEECNRYKMILKVFWFSFFLPCAAIGMQASLDLLERVFLSIAKQPNNTDCSDVDGICPLSCESVDVNCYLIDNNGFTLVSKEKEDVGKFFGEIDGSVMAQLLKSGLFKRVTLYDYQAMCKNAHHHTSGARPLLSPFYGLLALVKWFFSHFVMFLLEFNICGLWHNDYVVDAHRQKKVELMQPCNTEYPGFMYDTSIRETNSIIKCGRCQKMFVLQQVPNSNLVMLVVQADCDCSRQYAPITLAPREVKYNATVKCNRMKSQKIRRRPESCHAYHHHENAKDCGGACGIAVSLTLCFICLATSLALH
ncbi:voltage-dependent calcium channel subunit alpha-2/delta-4-like [Cyprinus carpio]|uniref:Voltage-dependent calcium channel subunit alpha-2/delta-4-like n=1 Tax=Cyprinus carpio TaxID=7962 RepID=A0A9Q9XWK7_CYPCA|nr:voltage-dependent calcium channel subunit alpha-2/delta-4-like [Cyprinus carpio]